MEWLWALTNDLSYSEESLNQPEQRAEGEDEKTILPIKLYLDTGGFLPEGNPVSFPSVSQSIVTGTNFSFLIFDWFSS